MKKQTVEMRALATYPDQEHERAVTNSLSLSYHECLSRVTDSLHWSQAAWREQRKRDAVKIKKFLGVEL